jgi:hypothetical protein
MAMRIEGSRITGLYYVRNPEKLPRHLRDAAHQEFTGGIAVSAQPIGPARSLPMTGVLCRSGRLRSGPVGWWVHPQGLPSVLDYLCHVFDDELEELADPPGAVQCLSCSRQCAGAYGGLVRLARWAKVHCNAEKERLPEPSLLLAGTGALTSALSLIYSRWNLLSARFRSRRVLSRSEAARRSFVLRQAASRWITVRGRSPPVGPSGPGLRRIRRAEPR